MKKSQMSFSFLKVNKNNDHKKKLKKSTIKKSLKENRKELIKKSKRSIINKINKDNRKSKRE